MGLPGQVQPSEQITIGDGSSTRQVSSTRHWCLPYQERVSDMVLKLVTRLARPRIFRCFFFESGSVLNTGIDFLGFSLSWQKLVPLGVFACSSSDSFNPPSLLPAILRIHHSSRMASLEPSPAGSGKDKRNETGSAISIRYCVFKNLFQLSLLFAGFWFICWQKSPPMKVFAMFFAFYWVFCDTVILRLQLVMHGLLYGPLARPRIGRCFFVGIWLFSSEQWD